MNKLEFYRQMAESEGKEITSSFQKWTAFLQAMARLYKYPYHEQLMIHAQRPDATACASYDLWNEKMGRYIRRGSKGIALLDQTGEHTKVRYVFDVTDTQSRSQSRPVNLWSMENEHIPVVSAMLEQTYGIDNGHGIMEQLEKVSAHLVSEHWDAFKQDVFDIVADSFLEGYDDFNIEAQFYKAASVSTAYCLMSRCGLEPERYFMHEDFLSVFDFNTADAAAVLGSAISQVNQQVLRQIEITIKNYEREKLQQQVPMERMAEQNGKPEVQTERRLSDPGSEIERTGEQAPGQVWQNAEALSEGEPASIVEPADPVREAVLPPAGDRRDSKQPSGTDDAADGAESGRDGTAESQQSDAMGADDEQPESAGGGNHPAGADLQLTIFPPESEQISYIDQLEAAQSTSSFSMSIPQEVVDAVLQRGSNADDARMIIAAEFSKDKSLADRADFLKTLFHGGIGIVTDTGRYAAWSADDGIHLAAGAAARRLPAATLISWDGAAIRVSEMLEAGNFATNVELEEALGTERHLLAQSLWYLYRDLSEQGRDLGMLQNLEQYEGGGFPDETERITEALSTPESYGQILSAFDVFSNAYENDKSLLRFHYHDVSSIHKQLQEFSLPRTEYTSQLAELTPVRQFITEDEIAASFSRGSGVYGGKERIYDYFSGDHTLSEKAEFLKHEYGIGGHSHALSGSSHSHEDHDSRGIVLQKWDCPEVQISWNNAAKRITELVQKGHYLTEEELSARQEKEAAQELADQEEVTTFPSSNAPDVETLDPIDAAIEAWNGSEDSKQTVALYMADHSRDKDTAQWLQEEFGGNLDLFPVPNTDIRLSWTKVQRHLAKLIQEDRFLHEQEHDLETEPHWVKTREEKEQLIIDSLPEDKRRIVNAMETAGFRYHPLSPGGGDDHVFYSVANDYPISFQNWDEAYEWIDTAQLKDEPGLREKVQAVLHPSAQRYVYPYHVGDKFYVEGMPYTITDIDPYHVELLPTGMIYPIYRSEPRANFERLLAEDPRNYDNYNYAIISPEDMNADILSVFTEENALFSDALRQEIIQKIDDGATNQQIGDFMYEHLVGRKETIQTSYGMELLCEVQEDCLSFEFQDVSRALYNLHWEETAAAIRAVPDQFLTPEKTQVQEETIAVNVTNQIPAENFRIVDEHLGDGGPRAKYLDNLRAIQLLKQLHLEERQAAPDEQEILSRYTGWGGLPDAFDPDKVSWAKEYQELKETLTPAEYEAARASTLNAHYTSPVVIRSIYEAIENLGFQAGNILEPSCGVGNFFGLLPDSMAGSHLYGVELDPISGQIAQQLYPKADIQISGFEKTDRRDFYDLAIGNVPFGQYQVDDKAYNKLKFNIHNYFFAKSLDQIRPGGIVAFITSRYTMDSKDSTVRQYLAQRADLLGAIRLPNTAFKTAGTEVVSDILFLQRRDRPMDLMPDWTQTGINGDGYTINNYFLTHPEMILGKSSERSGAHGAEYTVEPIDGANLSDQLHEAIQNIHGMYEEAELPYLNESSIIDTSIPADPDVKNYSYTIVNGEVYYRENSRMVQPDLNATAKERVKGMVALRDCVHKLIDQQLDGYTTDTEIQKTQAELNELYDNYTGKFGLINSRANSQAFSSDSSYYLLCSLEVLDEDKQLERKADIFTKRTIRPHEAVTSVDTASEALALSISEKACVDMEYMSALTGKTEQELFSDLRGVIFKDMNRKPDGSYTYRTADDFLSGNVREKLEYYTKALDYTEGTDKYDAMLDNVEALKQAQPTDLDASEIEVRLGATWIDPVYIKEFMFDLLKPPFYVRRSLDVNFSEFTADWNIKGKSVTGYNDINARVTYGTDRINAYKILEETLNLHDVRVYDTVTDPDGKERRVLNSKETTLAQQKQQLIKDAFMDWIWKDPDRRQELVAKYNRLYNSNRPREYDGSHITFAGMNPEIKLRDHQLNAVAHILYGGNTLLAHQVGAGKTFEMTAACMESKRLGLCQKALFAVPNHLVEQWSSEFLRLYPSAKLLVTTKKDFEPKNRKKFCGRIATGDYDAIIMGHSQFERIPVSAERQERLLNDQIAEIEDGLEELKNSGAEHFTVKSLERTKKSLEVKLKKLMDTERKDDVVTFEQLGVDRLFVDEAHSFKNLFLYTKMRNVAGLSTSDAQKSSDMLMKCRYLDEITSGKGVVFATGTPVSNSMTELYTMMRYLQNDTLRERGLAHFDCWASTFGETNTAIELAPEGTGYRARTRFSKFFNLPELMTLFKEVADIKTADQLNLPTPEAIYHNEVAQPTDIQKEMVQELSKRAATVHSGAIDASEDNMLKITSDGRKLGLDQRVINPDLPDDPSSKVNMCVRNISRIYEEGQEDRLTQLVFCDLSTPKNLTVPKVAKAAAGNLDNPELHALEAGLPSQDAVPSFNIYDDIREKLIATGIPRDEIAYIHEANTEVKKKELFAKVRSGQVRVLIGSTAKMGSGMNVQDRLIALHDLDCPWRPGDLEQRSGRIIRQGNRNEKVHIYRYVTEGSFDSYLWQTVENKQKFISQIMSSKSPVRACDDVDETALSYAEIKALCAGDPRIKEKMDLDVDVARLKVLKANHQSQQYRLEDNLLRYYPAKIEEDKGFIKGFEADLATVAAHPQPKEGFVGMVVKDDVLTDKDNAGAALLEAFKDVKGLEGVPIGTYRGFQMSLTLENFGKEYVLTLKGNMTHRVKLGRDARGNLTRIDNTLASMEDRLKSVQDHLSNLHSQMAAAKEQVGKPFPQEEELRSKSARLSELNSELNIDDKTPMEAIAEEVTGKRKPSILQTIKSQPYKAETLQKRNIEMEVR